MTYYRTLFIVALLTLVGPLANRSDAALMPGVETLADLLTRGDVTVAGVRYYDFAYGYRGASAPSPSAVYVDAPASGPGLTLSANWNSAIDGWQTITLQFRAAAGESLNHFKSVTTTMTGRSAAASGTGRAMAIDAINVTSPQATTVYNIAQGGAAATSTTSTTYEFANPLTELLITKTIDVRSAAGTPSAITSVSTVFDPIHLPEPGILTLGAGAMWFALRHRRSTRAISSRVHAESFGSRFH